MGDPPWYSTTSLLYSLLVISAKLISSQIWWSSTPKPTIGLIALTLLCYSLPSLFRPLMRIGGQKSRHQKLHFVALLLLASSCSCSIRSSTIWRQSTTSSTSWWLLELNYVPHPTSTVVHDINKLTMLTREHHRRPSTLVPPHGTSLLFLFLFAFDYNTLIILVTDVSISHKHIYDIKNLLLFFWIKIVPKFLSFYS